MSEVKLYHGDCLTEMNRIADKSVDMILCDLPYGTTQNSWDNIIPFDEMWKQYNRIIKDNCAIVLFGSQPFTSKLVCSNIENFKCEWIYKKKVASNFGNAKIQPMKEHENVLVFCNGKIRYFPIKEERKGSGASRIKYSFKNSTNSDCYATFDYDENHRRIQTELRFPSSIQEFNNRGKEFGLHPTQKPTALLEYLIKTYTLENETVLDNCMGSGSTGVACINTNRNFIGIELDDNYFKIAEDRINKAKESIFDL